MVALRRLKISIATELIEGLTDFGDSLDDLDLNERFMVSSMKDGILTRQMLTAEEILEECIENELRAR